MIRWSRRLTQLATLLFLLIAPALQIWSVGATTRWSPEELEYRYGPLARRTVETLQAVGDPPPELAGAMVGGTWSMRLAGLEITDPIAGLGQLLVHLSWPLLLGAVLVLALQALLGRAFCGWVCPYGTLSRLVTRARPSFALPGTLPTPIRYVVLAAVVLMPVLGLSLASLLPYVAVSRTLQGFFFGSWVGSAMLVATLLLSDLLLWKHGVCRSVCPSGALQRLVAKWARPGVVAKKGIGCDKGCHDCAQECWLGLDPRAGKAGPDCDSCGRCVAVCPPMRLKLGRRKGA